jgi:hypothetical protein
MFIGGGNKDEEAVSFFTSRELLLPLFLRLLFDVVGRGGFLRDDMPPPLNFLLLESSFGSIEKEISFALSSSLASSRPSEVYFFPLVPERYKRDADRWTMEGVPNPLLLRIVFDVVNTRIIVETARMDILLILSSAALLMLLRRRFFELKSGASRDDDDASSKFFIIL